MCAVARAAVDHPELTELEVNPLLVHPGGAIALDAHGVLDRAGSTSPAPVHRVREEAGGLLVER